MIGLIVLSKVVLASFLLIVAELARRWIRPHYAFVPFFAIVLILLTPALIVIPGLDFSRSAEQSFPETEVQRTSQRDDQAFRLGMAVRKQPVANNSPETKSGEIAIWRSLGNNVTALLQVIPVQLLIGLIWLVGSLLIVLRYVLKMIVLGRLVAATVLATGKLAIRHAAIARHLGMKRFPRLAVARGTFSPFLWHPLFGQSRIVLPEKLVDQLSIESLECVMRHELIHFRRRDALRRWFEFVAIAIWWWFPVSWIARRRLIELEEIFVDAEVIRTAPNSKKAYATALVDTEEFLATELDLQTGYVPALMNGKSLKNRVENIVNREVEKMSFNLNRVHAVALLLVFFPLGLLTAGSTAVPVSDRNLTAENEITPEVPVTADAGTALQQEAATTTTKKKRKYKIQDDDSEQSTDKSKHSASKKGNVDGITLTRRTNTEYGQSAYSFRYRTQVKDKHRNYVDLVYSADGKLRINNHGGMEARIAELGKTDHQEVNAKQLKSARWTNQNLPPNVGHTYALEIKAYDERGQIKQMQVVFRVVDVEPAAIKIVWNQDQQPPWPVDNSRFGMAGASGMNRSADYRR